MEDTHLVNLFFFFLKYILSTKILGEPVVGVFYYAYAK